MAVNPWDVLGAVPGDPSAAYEILTITQDKTVGGTGALEAIAEYVWHLPGLPGQFTTRVPLAQVVEGFGEAAVAADAIQVGELWAL